jgi:hypothetical protein
VKGNNVRYVLYFERRDFGDSRKVLIRGIDQIPPRTGRDYRPCEGSTIKRTARQL